MPDSIVEQCVQQWKDGSLTEQKLRDALEHIKQRPVQQKLLYLFTSSNELTSKVVGMSMYENGEMSDGPVHPDDWPYQKVTDALKDHWSIIHFPRAESVASQGQRYVPYEFILEKKERSESK